MAVLTTSQTPTSRNFGEILRPGSGQAWGTPLARGTPTPPGFLLVEPEPKRRSIWPIAFLLLFVGTAGWAYYVHRMTGSYPEFFNNLVSTSRQTLQGKTNLPEQNPVSGKSDVQDSASNDGATAQPAGNSAVSQPAGGDSEVAPSIPATGVGTGEATEAAPNEVPPSADAVQGSQSVTTLQPPGPAAPAERSPVSPVGNEEQSNGSSSVQAQNKPNRPLMVDGFTKKNVPELLRVAEIAAQRRDYRLARYEYNLILKLDHNNAKARTGLRLVQEAERLR